MLNCQPRTAAPNLPGDLNLKSDASDVVADCIFIRQFFADHKGKLLLVGVLSLFAAMALIGTELFSVGLTIPFTSELSVGLFSFGVCAIAVACAAQLSEIGSNKDKTGADVSDQEKKVLKAQGKRSHNRFMPRRVPVVKVPVSATPRPPVVIETRGSGS